MAAVSLKHVLLSLTQALACTALITEIDPWSVSSFSLLDIAMSAKTATFKFSYCGNFHINLNSESAPEEDLQNRYQVTISGGTNQPSIEVCTVECVTENIDVCDEEIVLKLFWSDDKFQVDVGCPGRRIFSGDLKYEPDNGIVSVNDYARLEIMNGDDAKCPTTTTTTSTTTTSTTTTTTTTTPKATTTVMTSNRDTESGTTMDNGPSGDKGQNMDSGVSDLRATSGILVLTSGVFFVIFHI